MSPKRIITELPEEYKTWAEFNKAKKERKRQRQELKLESLEEKKTKKQAQIQLDEQKRIKDKCPELSTLTIAVPGSIMDNAQSAELRTYLAGQIARAACIYQVDEIVVYDDVGVQDNVTARTVESVGDDGEVQPARRCCAQLARILQYLECPQYLRKDFFPPHRDLQYAGLLNPLDAPHHMRQHDDTQFREGVILPQPAKNGSFANVGLLKQAKVDKPIQPGVRVTVEMLPSQPDAKRLPGRVVPPTTPRQKSGTYWGYSVRLANSLSAIFSQCPYKKGYDVTIGTSERGDPVEDVTFNKHKHALIVFGGLKGLEAALEADEVLTVDNPAFLFDRYINTCPEQGSRTIRTEEAILITLAELRCKLKPKFVFRKSDREKTKSEEEEDKERTGIAESSDYKNETHTNNDQGSGAEQSTGADHHANASNGSIQDKDTSITSEGKYDSEGSLSVLKKKRKKKNSFSVYLDQVTGESHQDNF